MKCERKHGERAIKRRTFFGRPICLPEQLPPAGQRMNAMILEDDVNVIEREAVLERAHRREGTPVVRGEAV